MNEIVVDGVLRDLRHLRSFAVTVPNKGKDGADLIVRVSLGLHTVSRGCERGAHHFEDENGKPRQFCEDRYAFRSEEHTSELQSLMRISYAVFCLKKKITDFNLYFKPCTTPSPKIQPNIH